MHERHLFFSFQGPPFVCAVLLRPGSVWSYYDRSRAHSLSPAEAQPIAVWLFGRIPVLFRQMVKRANPTKTKAEHDALVIEHLPHLLPGTSEEIVSNTNNGEQQLMRERASAWRHELTVLMLPAVF